VACSPTLYPRPFWRQQVTSLLSLALAARPVTLVCRRADAALDRAMTDASSTPAERLGWPEAGLACGRSEVALLLVCARECVASLIGFFFLFFSLPCDYPLLSTDLLCLCVLCFCLLSFSFVFWFFSVLYFTIKKQK
jgi:hypothetical protein